MTEQTATTAPVFTENEGYVLDRMDYTSRYWQGLRETAKQKVAEDANSDWALMTDLAAAYGRDGEHRRLNQYLLAIRDGRLTIADALTNWSDSIMQDLLMIRIMNSSSPASNLINEQKLSSLQESYKLVTGWTAALTD